VLRIELDITYRCDLGCVNCNRLCGLAPRDEEMSVDQVDEFCLASQRCGIYWDRVAILGGEPTLHPDLVPIMQMVAQVSASVLLCTNGRSGIHRPWDLGLPRGPYYVADTNKTGPIQPFLPMTDAACDSLGIPDAQYRQGCPLPGECGFGANRAGYYPCPLAGVVDRFFGLGLAVSSPEELLAGNPGDVFEKACRYCGHFWGTLGRKREEAAIPTISRRWRVALDEAGFAC